MGRFDNAWLSVQKQNSTASVLDSISYSKTEDVRHNKLQEDRNRELLSCSGPKKVKFKNVREVGVVLNKGFFRNLRKIKRKGKLGMELLEADKANSASVSNPNFCSIYSEPPICSHGAGKVEYGNQVENSDIIRNNSKQWGYLDDDIGRKL